MQQAFHCCGLISLLLPSSVSSTFFCLFQPVYHRHFLSFPTSVYVDVSHQRFLFYPGFDLLNIFWGFVDIGVDSSSSMRESSYAAAVVDVANVVYPYCQPSPLF